MIIGLSSTKVAILPRSLDTKLPAPQAVRRLVRWEALYSSTIRLSFPRGMTKLPEERNKKIGIQYLGKYRSFIGDTNSHTKNEFFYFIFV